jgi:hypothetical protein
MSFRSEFVEAGWKALNTGTSIPAIVVERLLKLADEEEAADTLAKELAVQAKAEKGTK